MKHFKTISQLYHANGFPPPENPLLSLVTCEELKDCPFAHTEFTTDFYIIGLKKIKSGTFLYGKTKYDHDNGSLSFIKPRQVIQISDVESEEKGFVICVHEDYFLQHSLHSEIKKYTYFDYEINEALHLSPKEEETIWDLFYKIRTEYHNNQDEFSKSIIISHIDSILKYSQRFYKRQFLDRTMFSGTIISRFTEILKVYFESGRLEENGLPSVKYMGAQLSVSSR